MKKKILLILVSLMVFLLSSCASKTNNTTTKDDTTITPITTDSKITTGEKTTTMANYYNPKESVDDVVLEDIELSFKFFWETQNTNELSEGCGLIPDRYTLSTNKVGTLASIASVGYGLAAFPIGVEHGFITKEEGYDRALMTLSHMENLQRMMGFYFHFYYQFTGKKAQGSEVSIIDTAIFLNGALVAGKYFGGEVEEIANRIYDKVNWTWYFDKDATQFYMGYNYDTGQFGGHWGPYAEQLMIFILAAGSKKYPVGRQAYILMKSLSKKSSAFGSFEPFYMTYNGSLFIFQYSHAFFDSKRFVDADGVSWYDNSVNASLAAYDYAQTLSQRYKTYSQTSWGNSACDGPNGYNGSYGSAPSSGNAHRVDGTVCLSAAPASIVFTETQSLNALKYYRSNPKLWCKYGLIDSYNLGTTSSYTDDSINIPEGGWYAADLIGIDKGNELMMLENYYSSLIWNIYQSVDAVKDGLKVLGFKEV